jgi:hypothetical protein
MTVAAEMPPIVRTVGGRPGFGTIDRGPVAGESADGVACNVTAEHYAAETTLAAAALLRHVAGAPPTRRRRASRNCVLGGITPAENDVAAGIDAVTGASARAAARRGRAAPNLLREFESYAGEQRGCRTSRKRMTTLDALRYGSPALARGMQAW